MVATVEAGEYRHRYWNRTKDITLSLDERSTSITVGVVLAREATDHPWQDFRWYPIELLIGAPDHSVGDVLAEGDGFKHFFAGNATLEMHRADTSAYVVNLENDPPSIYVVLREAETDETPLPYELQMVTASPFEAQDFLDSGEEIVEPIPMSGSLVAWVERFVATHHREEVFRKRQRDRVNLDDERFGQEPLTVIRQRQRH